MFFIGDIHGEWESYSDWLEIFEERPSIQVSSPASIAPPILSIESTEKTVIPVFDTIESLGL